MTALNARANQSWREYACREKNNDEWPPNEQQGAFVEGWETGYKAAEVDINGALEAGTAPRPLIDREEVRRLMADALTAYVQLSTPGYYNYVDSFVALARPAPTREQVDKLVSDWFRATLSSGVRDVLADAILELMGGAS